MICPPRFRETAQALRMSPAIEANGLIFLTGVTGSDPAGHLPSSPEAQFRAAFAKIEELLREAGLGLDAIVEMTTYHVGLRDHFELFDNLRVELLAAPYPAWTAVEVAGLRREGAVVEMRVIAARGASDAAPNSATEPSQV